MAQNLFEKYGIKEVADVWLSRIERKEETYESQRKIPVSSILKSALTLETVYPLDTDGKGADEGYEAYVFKDADVLTHYNYDCDDEVTVIGKGYVLDVPGEEPEAQTDADTGEVISDYPTKAESYYSDSDAFTEAYTNSILTINSAYDKNSLRNILSSVKAYLAGTDYEISEVTISDVTISNSYNTSSTLDGNASVDGSTLITYVSYLKSAYSDATTLDTQGNEVSYPPEIYFTVAKSDAYNWVAVRAAIAEYLLSIDASEGYGIDIDETDVYGIYTVPKSTTEESTSTALTTVDVSAINIDFTYTDGDGNSISVNLSYSDEEYLSVALPTSVVEYLTGASATEPDAEDVVAALEILYNTDGVTVTPEDVTDSENQTLSEDYEDGDELSIDFSYIEGFNYTIVPMDDDSYESGTFILTIVLYPIYSFNYEIVFASAEEALTGIFDVTTESPDNATGNTGHYVTDPDYADQGTHEFTYAEQVCLIFAKAQNLITKRGTRYQFTDANTTFSDIEFSDEFAAAPNSSERVVVAGLADKISENLYDLDEINEYIKTQLTDTIDAKAYDIVYTDYAELVVEDEMGYYLPQQLGTYNRTTKKMEFFGDGGYTAYATALKGVDIGISTAVSTWGNDKHYSINDAIDALKQEKRVIDGEVDLGTVGFERIFGGYKVLGADDGEKEKAGLPFNDGQGVYGYEVNGEAVTSVIDDSAVYSGYPLDSVLEAIASMESQIEGAHLRVNNDFLIQSNRAIYVDAASASTSARAHIYLLRNINAKKLTSDSAGIFEFYDKKGNKLHYQDRIFAGTEYLALVTIGQSGLIFVVERHGTKNIDKIAWMVSDGGFLTNKQAEKIVANGLIHTVDVTVCDESFDATCTVGSIKIRKTKKSVLHYVPVLYLDTLKVSTIEQAAETVDATGGRGNAKLITWDFSKEITLSIEDALFTPASMAAIWGGEHGDVKNGVKDTHHIDRMEKITAKRSFIVPAGNSLGTPTEGDITAQAVYYDPQTMEPFQDGTPIAEGEVIYKFTRSVAYDDNSIGNTIEISAEKFPGTYRVVGETYVRDKKTGEDQRFQFVIPEAKHLVA